MKAVYPAELRQQPDRGQAPHSTVKFAVSEIAPAVAVMVTVCTDATVEVLMEKVAVVLPWGTVRVNGTDATRELLLFSATTTPPNGAGPERVTVPVAVSPPFTCVGDTARLCN